MQTLQRQYFQPVAWQGETGGLNISWWRKYDFWQVWLLVESNIQARYCQIREKCQIFNRFGLSRWLTALVWEEPRKSPGAWARNDNINLPRGWPNIHQKSSARNVTALLILYHKWFVQFYARWNEMKISLISFIDGPSALELMRGCLWSPAPIFSARKSFAI